MFGVALNLLFDMLSSHVEMPVFKTVPFMLPAKAHCGRLQELAEVYGSLPPMC